MEDFVDLHLHTTRSDGSMSPGEIVMYSKYKGLRAIAVTDHDTVSGNEEACREGEQQGVEVIAGVELSIAFERGELHLLGYYLDYQHPELQNALRELREHRKQRNPLIIQKLAGMNIHLDLGAIRRAANNGNVGRPHIAAAMVDAGYVVSVKEAFDLYLKKEGPAYVPKEHLTPEQGIDLIHRYSGIPVLAHPSTLEINDYDTLLAFIGDLKQKGLRGIEVYYLSHSRHQVRLYKSIAERLDLCVTGGSDFHGPVKPHIEIGTGRGTTRLPYALVENLKRLLPPSHQARKPHRHKIRRWLPI